MRTGLLGLGAEYGVAAANVGHHRVLAAGGIAQFHEVLLARPAAILITGPSGEEAAEHAVLRVEYGQVLIRDGFDTRTAHRASEAGNLRRVEVVTRCKA